VSREGKIRKKFGPGVPVFSPCESFFRTEASLDILIPRDKGKSKTEIVTFGIMTKMIGYHRPILAGSKKK